MLRHYILLFPCFSCTLWALVLLLNRKRNTIPQNIWMILMMLMAGSTYVWAVFYEGVTDYAMYYKLDIIDTTFTLFLFPLIHLYFKSLVSKNWFGWQEVLWLLPGILIGCSSAILYLAMGDTNATSYIKEVINHQLNLQVHTDPVYRLQVLINIYGFYITVFIQAVAVVVITTIEFIKPKGYLRALFRSPTDKTTTQVRTMIIAVWLLLLISLTAFWGGCFAPIEFPDLTSFLMVLIGLLFIFLGYIVYNQNLFHHLPEHVPLRHEPVDVAVSTNSIVGDDSSILFRFNKLMEEKVYLKKNLRVEDVAVMICTNRTYISRLLKEEFECTFTDLINRKRIEYAKKLMYDNPRLNQEEVARKSGFTHTSSFSRIFKQYTGITFRQAQKHNLSQSHTR